MRAFLRGVARHYGLHDSHKRSTDLNISFRPATNQRGVKFSLMMRAKISTSGSPRSNRDSMQQQTGILSVGAHRARFGCRNGFVPGK